MRLRIAFANAPTRARASLHRTAWRPAALWLRRRFPLERETLRRVLPVHLLAIAALCLLHAAAALWLTTLLIDGGEAGPINVLTLRLVFSWLRDLPFCVLFYGLPPIPRT